MSIRRALTAAGSAGLCLALMSLVLAPMPAMAGEEGAASPEAVAEGLKAAAAAKDFGKLVGLLHPDDRPELALGLLLAGGMAAAFSEDSEAATKDFEALLKKHGLEDKAEGPGPGPGAEGDMKKAAQEAFEGVELAAFLPDMFAFMEKHTEDSGKTPFSFEEMTDLKIDGDTATAKAGEENLKFSKVGDRWFIHAD